MSQNPFDKFDVSETALAPTVTAPLTEDIKNPFTETQNKAASFAYRQLKAIEETDALMAGGYNPSTDIYNYIASALPDVFFADLASSIDFFVDSLFFDSSASSSLSSDFNVAAALETSLNSSATCLVPIAKKPMLPAIIVMSRPVGP